MSLLFLAIVLLHGVIHLLGFVKGFQIREVKELTLPISRPMGLAWLTATLLFLLYGLFYLLQLRYAWAMGVAAVALSQLLIILYRKDAGMGTLPNVVILMVALISMGSQRFQHKVDQEVTHLLEQQPTLETTLLDEQTIASLPDPVKNWLRSSGAAGRPVTRVGKVVQKAELQLKPGQKRWMPAKAIQFTTLDPPAFVWHVEGQLNRFVTFSGLDRFGNGKGSMLVKLQSLLMVASEEGEKINEGTLQRYLGEMVWFPSLAISPNITWEAMDDTTAVATLYYGGTEGSGIFHFNAGGEVVRFSAMRFMGNEPEAERREWIMEITDYATFEGIRVPFRMHATWKLEEGDWTWLQLEVTSIQYNENIDDERIKKQ